MGTKTKKGKGRLDKFYHLAKEQGYRSRAAFKLIQLNRKYNFLANCRALLDLCAAPGGWLQVAAKNMPVSSLILGVDLVPIKPVRGTKTIIGDITTQATRTALKKEAKGSLFDVVVHDGAPNVGGAWSNEAYTQAALVLDSLKLATEFLVPKGTFVTKIFRSKDYNALLYAFNQLFEKVEATKPTASRNTSAEIFVVCQGYKAPAKIDPRLMDPRHLFQDLVEAPKVMGPDALMKLKIKQKRHREGYEEGVSSLFKSISALQFIASPTPVELLGKASQIALDGPVSWQPVEGLESPDLKELADQVRRHASTTGEMRALCGDLQVLGRTEFKALLRWRLALRKALATELGELPAEPGHKKKKKEEGAKAADAGQAGEGEGDDMDPEEKLLLEMKALKETAERRERKEKKKQKESKRKARIRAAQLGSVQAPVEDNGPDGMFSLHTLPGDAGALTRLAEAKALGDKEMELLEAPDSDDEDYYLQAGRAPGGSEDGGEEEEDASLRYELELEEALETSYKQYLERKGHRDDVYKEKRRRLGMDMELEEGADGEDVSGSDADGEDDDDEDDEDDERRARGRGASKKGDAEGSGAGLLVELDARRAGVAQTAPAMATQWFSQELFNDPNLMEDDEDDDDEEEDDEEERHLRSSRAASHAAAGPRNTPSAASAGKAGGKAGTSATVNGNGVASSANGKAATVTAATAAAAAALGDSDSDSDGGLGRRAKSGDGFEIVPASKSRKSGGGIAGKGKGKGAGEGDESDGSSGTDSEDEFDLLDDQGKAEVLALAKRMLRRKEKESIVDAAYNRYAFHDEGLPRWFAEDEKRHMRPIMPVSKEEVEAEKARLRAVDARPIKKVAEAKGRKKRRVMARLQSAKEKAESIAAQEDVPMGSKMREIEKLYAKARAAGKGKGGKGAKGGKGGKAKKGPPLDKRMRKDARGQKAAEKRSGGKKKGGKGGKSGGRKGR